MTWLYGVLFFVAGAVVGTAVQLIRSAAKSANAARLATQVEERDARIRELQSMLAARETELRTLAENRARLQASLETLTDLRTKLEETFKVLAGDTLKSNSDSFLGLARSQIETLLLRENTQMEKRREEIEKVVRPLAEDLKKYETLLKDIETARVEHYAGLREQAANLAEAHERLRKETSNLVNALRHPQTRGRWGELTLRRVAELAGMVPHCDFSEQVTTSEGLRPDMVVHLPAGRDIVVDSKVALDAFLDALEAPDEETRAKKMAQHANQVRTHMDQLARKEYGRQFEKSPEFVVLFLPGESFFNAAVQHDPSLVEDGMRRGVIVATPSTLLALLLSVARGWRQASVEEDARRICEEGRELHKRFVTLLSHFRNMGKGLQSALTAYNSAMGSVESRVFPSLRKLEGLKAILAEEAESVAPIEGAPRQIEAPDELPPVEPRA